jgi:hypothetical protein
MKSKIIRVVFFVLVASLLYLANYLFQPVSLVGNQEFALYQSLRGIVCVVLAFISSLFIGCGFSMNTNLCLDDSQIVTIRGWYCEIKNPALPEISSVDRKIVEEKVYHLIIEVKPGILRYIKINTKQCPDIPRDGYLYRYSEGKLKKVQMGGR